MIRLTERTVFLFDGIGALLSAAFSGLVLPRLELGLSSTALCVLVAFPVVYSVYSLSRYRAATIKPWMLAAVIAANLLYCVVSGLVLLWSPAIIAWGQALLLGEIVLVLVVVAIEIRVFRHAF